MRYVSIIEDKKYLLWQQEIQARNLIELGEAGKLVVVILYGGAKPYYYQGELDDLCEVHCYQNLQLNRSYIPSNKPYGLKRLLTDHPEYGKDLFLIDSDVIFREIVDFESMDDPGGMYSSDCSSYLGWEYIVSKYPESRLPDLLSLSGLTIERITEINKTSGGAQYYFKSITPDFCEKVELDSILIYQQMCKARDEDGSDIQVWTGEMWAWLWNSAAIFNIYTPKELEFCWATDHEARWDATKILHLAGVVGEDMGLFYKGAYTNTYPWECSDFSYITKKDTCSWVYFTKMMNYKGVEICQ